MELGYCSNGLCHHSVLGGLELISSIGYKSVAICVDHGWLSPFDPSLSLSLEQAKDFLSRTNLSSVIEATGPFVLDPLIRDTPSLTDADPTKAAARIDYIRHCIDIAAEFKSRCVSIRSGNKPAGLSYSTALELFVNNLTTVANYADEQGVELALEPTPGMLIDNTGRFERLLHLSGIEALKLTLDIGQLFCLSEVPIANFIERWKDHLINIHLCDVKVGRPEHLLFGNGQIYLPPIFESLVEIKYQHGIHVELDRHSFDAATVARQSFDVLEPVFSDIVDSDFQ